MLALVLLFHVAGAYARIRDPLNSLRSHQYAKRATTTVFPPELTADEAVLVNSFNSASISDWSYYYTHGLHVAGTNKSMAQWTADRWAENGFDSRLYAYDVYINYPVSHSMSLAFSNGSTYIPTLEEAVLTQDETTSYPNRVPTFHGYSATGNVSAEYVYVGRGQQVDFARLKSLNVSLVGKIALAKYGGPFRGLKVKNAQNEGMIGCVIFNDPGDDGSITEANGYAAYPNGPARNPTSVQRGSVEFLSTYPGDPTTPGYPSHEGVPRADKSAVVPFIPSLPISWIEAEPLLAALDGYGVPGAEIHGAHWVGKMNVTYSTGPNPDAILSMSNIMRDAITPLWDVTGIINGTSPDEVIILGNHRDAWIIGGAADPNSGSSILIELSKAFGKLVKTGWKPRRTIVLASWDGEEYGLLGSTEWVEEYVPWLTTTAVTYLNVDIGCSGPHPYFDASPELHEIAIDVGKKIIYPQAGSSALFPEQTFYDVWHNYTNGSIGVLGSGSDFTAFLHNGIGAMDVGATDDDGDPIYHYHSNFDSFHWMSTYGDPEFAVHTVMGQYISVLLYHLANDVVIPFNTTTYAQALASYFDDLNSILSVVGASLDLTPLSDAINAFATSASQVSAQHIEALQSGDADLVKLVNKKYRDFQRGFVSQGGLPEREFYKHVVNAPGIDTGYAPVTYPGITEALEAGDFGLAKEWVQKTAKGILVAAGILAL